MDEWFGVLFDKIGKYMYKNGGPIIAVQVENEYGIEGCERDYMVRLARMITDRVGDDVVLFTTDTYYDWYMKCGTIPDIALATVDFPTGTDPKEAFAVQRQYNKGTGPLVDSEYYTGRMDH